MHLSDMQFSEIANIVENCVDKPGLTYAIRQNMQLCDMHISGLILGYDQILHLFGDILCLFSVILGLFSLTYFI